MGHGTTGEGHTHRTPLSVDLRSDTLACRQIGAGLGGCPGDLLHQHRHPHSAPASGVETIAHRDIVVGHHRGDREALGGGQFGGQFKVHHVAGIVLHDKEDTGIAVDGAGRGEHLVGHRRGEDRARTGRVEHPLADEPAVQRLVAGAPAGDERHLALHRGIGARDIVGVNMHPQQVRMRRGHTRQRLPNDVLGSIDQLFHCGYLPWYRRRVGNQVMTDIS